MDSDFISFMYQTMLGIMYSFALSGEIQNTFKIVNEGIIVRSEAEGAENKILRDSVALYIGDATLKAKLAEIEVLQETHKTFLKGLKYALINRGGGIDEESGDLNDRSNMKVSSFLFVANHQGEELYHRMQNLAKAMQAVAVTEEAKKRIGLVLIPSKLYTAEEWSKHTFDHVPLTAAVTIITKFENDERIAEATLLRDLLYNPK